MQWMSCLLIEPLATQISSRATISQVPMRSGGTNTSTGTLRALVPSPASHRPEDILPQCLRTTPHTPITRIIRILTRTPSYPSIRHTSVPLTPERAATQIAASTMDHSRGLLLALIAREGLTTRNPQDAKRIPSYASLKTSRGTPRNLGATSNDNYTIVGYDSCLSDTLLYAFTPPIIGPIMQSHRPHL
ncbi:hypothetical protein FA13DRAFT_816625 [Coprinellus micaceus]|uniref:Uncharacterized protein n=1 Tax=Coprinellus micaceus TaxID=71717 RepID=A0A4Y7T2K1_COPMI|nr:hypothetical protein FA13DRAFT_816625 [Coprinellus micaceus]